MSQRPEAVFNAADLDQLRAAGIEPSEALRQIEVLRRPPRFTRVERPCSPGDGIRPIPSEELEDLEAAFDAAAREGRCSRFVPASGAATRMFRSLLHYVNAGPASRKRIALEAREERAEALEAGRFLECLERFAFHGELEVHLRRRGLDPAGLAARDDAGPILDALLGDDGLGYATCPKALIEFHAYPEGARTAFEEHLVEAALLVRDAERRCRVHFTAGEQERGRFAEALERDRPRYEALLGARLEVSLSCQRPSTDTLAVDDEGLPFRREDGALLLRPSGHGALLDNLNELGGDLVLVKNIDNVAPDRLKEPTFRWSRIIGGLALRLRDRTTELLEQLRGPESGRAAAVSEALAFAREVFHMEPGDVAGGLSPRAVSQAASTARAYEVRQDPTTGRGGVAQAHEVSGESKPSMHCAGSSASAGERLAPRSAALEEVIALLDRPIRICGMVVNMGEPGGGPFWVRDTGGGISLQIVETAQIDPASPEQQAILARATHTNPVFMACSVRDGEGRPYDLRRWVDPDAVIVTRKSHAGRGLKALERPGLWNGAMAGWNTVFVEVPLEVFNPVKTVNDLLRENHQPA